MTTVADVFDLPERVHQGDFVLRLSEGVERAEQTLRDYVVTPQLARCFEDALSLIGGAVGEGTSKGAYLHGSFGSGKSHFMAVLALLLRGDAGARSTPELAGAVAKSNTWTTGRRFLVVPYHLIGATSMESAILGHYAEHVRAVHPAAPTPGFYRADRLFADARALRANMGDAAFFRALNAAVRDGSGGGGQGGAPDGGGSSGGGWGSLGSDWDPAAFDAALTAAPGDEDRVRLVGDLIDAFFGAMRSAGAADGGEHFVPLDEGLAVMSRHAREFGYDALVLFLDELILWLASHAADPAFVNREGQKVAKLVEAMRADRPIPIVSFIARQRDLRELVGEHLPGAGQLGFADVLNWWEARFDQITLEDRNLPAIVQRRVLLPKDAAARAKLDAAFERTAKIRRDQMRARIRNCLLTAYGLSKADANAIDESHGLDEHFVSLNPRLALRPPVAAGFGEALRDVFAQALAASFPDHPEFGVEVRRPVLRRVWEVVERAAAESEGRVEVERRTRDEVRHVVEPLGLGEMGETHFKLGRRWYDELDRKRAHHGGETLTVRDLRAWIESPERRGLDREVQNLVILTYALQKGLRFTLHGGPAHAAIDRLDNGLELREQALPDPGDWQRAVRLAGAVFGIAASPLMNARNAGELAEALRKAVAGHRADVDTLAVSLRRRLQARGISTGDTDRARTAGATLALLSALDRAEDDALVATLAAAEVPTSDVAMGESLKGARELADALAPDRWAIFEKLAGLPEPYRERARRIAAALDDALRFDEHVTPLADTLRRSQSEALDLLAEAATAAPPDTSRPPEPHPPEPPEGPERPPEPARGIRTGRRSVAATRVRDVFTEIEDAVRETGANRVDVHWKVYSGPKFRGS